MLFFVIDKRYFTRENIIMYTRREFLQNAVIAASGMALCGCAKQTVFDTDQRACLIALAEQIIPADDKFGGATDAGVINYMETFAGKYYPEIIPYYAEQLAMLQKACVAVHSKKFQELAFDEQTAFMKKMEVGKVPSAEWNAAAQRSFFNEILTRSMQGFYGSPRHGGNKNYMSYKMLGLDMPVVVGQNRYGRRS